MKTITINSRRWDAKHSKMEEHKISFNISNETCKMMMKDFEGSSTFPLSTNMVEGQDYEVSIRDSENGEYVFQAVRL